MTSQTYYLAGVGIYLGFVSWVFVQSLKARQEGRDIVDEAIGSRRFSAPMIAMLVAVAMLGPADALALSQNGALYGSIWAVLPLGAALAQAVAGLFFVKRIHEQFPGRLSIGDVFAERSGPGARITVGIVVFAQAVAFAGVLVLAGGQVLESLVGIPLLVGMVLTAAVVGLSTAAGGIRAVVDTNKLQAVFVAILFILTFVAVVFVSFTSRPDWTEIIARPAFATEYSTNMIIGVFVAYFMGELLLPAYSVRALIAKDGKAARRGFLMAAGVLVIWYTVITTAGALWPLLSEAARGSTENAVLLDVVRAPLAAGSPLWHVLGAIVAAGLLALIHSTFNTFLNVGGVAMARDVLGSVIKDGAAQGAAERWSVLAIAGMGILVAVAGDTLVGLLIIGYTIWVPSLLAPFAWIIFNPRAQLSQAVFWAAGAAGAAGWAAFEYLFQTFMPGILAGFLCNVVVLVIGQSVVRSKGDAGTATA